VHCGSSVLSARTEFSCTGNWTLDFFAGNPSATVKGMEPPMNAHAQAVQALQQAFKAGRRGEAVAGISALFRQGAVLGDAWADVAQMALGMGEITLAQKASKRFSKIDRNDVMRQLRHAALLAEAGQVRAARAAMAAFEKKGVSHPSIDHFLGTVKALLGDAPGAKRNFLKVLEKWPTAGQSWFAYGALKTFTADDPDLLKMQSLTGQFGNIEPQTHGAFLYALGKAYEDIGDNARAFDAYRQGAQLFHQCRPFDQDADDTFCKTAQSTFTLEAMAELMPGHCDSSRPIFVTGLPRSGTTLVEQMLVSHSKVKDGGELNLFRIALMPLGGYSYAHAREYEAIRAGQDPWTEVANTYLHLLDERFGGGGHIVDKTLNHSRFIGLIRHCLPNAKIIWVRRDPMDTAWSCFKTYFNKSLDWTYSLENIARYFLMEDQMFAHWCRLYPQHIHVVEYEALVQDPEAVIPAMLAHCGLADEPATRRFYETRRSISTASLAQVRKPLSSGSIGKWQAYAQEMQPFVDIYQP
jgi:tetratricopeptide (TPR) repeat protein